MAHRIALVLGTRPEIVKMSPLIKILDADVDVIQTGQHFTSSMSEEIKQSVGLPSVAADLGIGPLRSGSQLGRAVVELDSIFDRHRPEAVAVQGDTTSALAGALAAEACDVPVVHVEAGLRSYDRRMPEEVNRVLIDHLADICCAPTEINRDNLLREAVSEERIVITGNTIVEAVHSLLPASDTRQSILRDIGMDKREYVLTTLHRPENVDDPDVLAELLESLGSLDVPVFISLHPRTADRVSQFGLHAELSRLRILNPLSYPKFLALAREATLLVSDSGGLQEEATILKTPIVVVRRSNERPEVEGSFGARISPKQGLKRLIEDWLKNAVERSAMLQTIASPFGDGTASMRVARILLERTQATNVSLGREVPTV